MAEHGHVSHGNSVAAWTCVGILMIAAAVGMIAVIFANIPLAVVAVVIAVIGLVAGKLLSLAGYGVERPSDPRVTHAVR